MRCVTYLLHAQRSSFKGKSGADDSVHFKFDLNRGLVNSDRCSIVQIFLQFYFGEYDLYVSNRDIPTSASFMVRTSVLVLLILTVE